MQHNIIVHNEPSVIEIKPATYNDINALITLNSKWQLANLNGNVDQGFVGAAFNADFYRTLIDRNEVIVAYDKECVGSIYANCKSYKCWVVKFAPRASTVVKTKWNNSSKC
jgi:hypothetical protein